MENPKPAGPALFLFCFLLTAALGVVDYVSGWELGFSVFYFLPIAIAAWRLSYAPTLAIAVWAGVTWFAAEALLDIHYSSPFFLFWNSCLRLLGNLLLAHFMSRATENFRRQRRLYDELLEANRQIKVLKGILPICASCKSIRNDKGYWEQLESYLAKYSDAEFSHGICETCIGKLYPEFKDRLLRQEGK